MASLLSFDGDSPADPRLVRPPSAHLGEAVAGCCRSVCDMRPRDQPPQHSCADTQQILGIDVPCLYEGTRLLGTPAGVRLVAQSALVVHKVAQVSPRTGQSLSKVVRSNLQHISNNGGAYLHDGTEG